MNQIALWTIIYTLSFGMLNAKHQKFILLVFSLFISIVLGELMIRFSITYDADGNAWIGNRILKPYKLPIVETQKNVNQYLRSQQPGMLYDSLLGWTLPADIKLRGLDSNGIRAGGGREYKMTKHDSVLRIALFGDSYVFGAEVDFESTIGCQLEQRMKTLGIKAEVINFGVGAYGIDQAFLKWKYHGKKFSPDIVIVGFQPENVKRNLNMLRTLYSRKEALPFSKPRFVIKGDSLQLINFPTVKPDQLVEIIKKVDQWNWIKEEEFYTDSDYVEYSWLNSKLFSCLVSICEENRFTYSEQEREYYTINQEPSQLALRIIKEFKKDVEQNQSTFYVLHLPRLLDLKDFSNGDKFVYADLLDTIDSKYNLIHIEQALIDKASQSSFSSLFMPGQHYSAIANSIVAEELTKAIHSSPPYAR